MQVRHQVPPTTAIAPSRRLLKVDDDAGRPANEPPPGGLFVEQTDCSDAA